MIAVLSPAKTLDYEYDGFKAASTPRLKNKTQELIDILKKKKATDLMKLMKINEKLGQLNFERYQNFSEKYTVKNSKPALSAFKGDVYLGLDVATLKAKDIDIANDKIRILSGLYGLLKPLDKMQPYRLEMGTKLQNASGKNLYKFWGDEITDLLNKDLKKTKSKYLINLASKEYFSAVNRQDIKAEVIDVGFKEYRDGQLKFLSFHAKKARGLMARYIIKENPKSINALKGFNYDNYAIDEALSSENLLMFTR